MTPITPKQIDAILPFLKVFQKSGFSAGGVIDEPGVFPSFKLNDTVLEFVQLVSDDGWVTPQFNWVDWQDSARKYVESSAMVEAADVLTIQKLLMTHVRRDRFCEGHLASMLENGHIQALLRRLKEIRAEMADASTSDESQRRVVQTFHADSLWAEIKRLADMSRYRVAAVAYVTDDKLLKFGEGDLLVVDASDHAIRTGQTDRRVLRRAFKRNAKLYSCPGLHAKVMVFDDAAVIASANLSKSSQKHLIEAGLVTNEVATVSSTRSFIIQLAEVSDEIDADCLARIDRIKIRKSGRGVVSSRRPGVSLRGRTPQVWLVGLRPDTANDEDSQKLAGWEAEAADATDDPHAEFSHFRITGKSGIRGKAKPGDLVIEMWREDPRSKDVDRVYRHVPIRLIRHYENRTCFFVENRPDAEDSSVSWSRFQEHLQEIGYRRKVVANSVQQVPAQIADSLLELWAPQ